MIIPPINLVVMVARGPVRGPVRQAKPKARAKASRGQLVGTRASAAAVGGGLGTS